MLVSAADHVRVPTVLEAVAAKHVLPLGVERDIRGKPRYRPQESCEMISLTKSVLILGNGSGD